MEQTYGIGVNNRYELFYDQDDVQDFETVISAKNKKKAKEPAQTPIVNPVQPKSVAEKENKQVKKPTLENGTGPQKGSAEPRRGTGIKEQQNNSNKDNSKSGECSRLIFLFWTHFHRFRVCVRTRKIYVTWENRVKLSKFRENLKIENIRRSKYCV